MHNVKIIKGKKLIIPQNLQKMLLAHEDYTSTNGASIFSASLGIEYNLILIKSYICNK